MALGTVAEEHGPGDAEQRTDEPDTGSQAPLQRHPGQTGRARAAKECQQDRLTLVLRMVRGEDTRRPGLARDAGELRVARAAQGCLGTRTRRERSNHRARFERGAQRQDDAFVATGRGPDPMIDVPQHDARAALRGVPRQECRQRRRIRAARNRRHERLAGLGGYVLGEHRLQRARRLSQSFLPRASAKSILTRPRLKYRRVGTTV